MSNVVKGIKCISPAFDCSGYAEWSRSYILALVETGIPVTLAPVKFEAKSPDLGESGEVLKGLVGKDIEYNAVISWNTPEITAKVLEQETNSDAIRINFTLWETDKLHPDWPRAINQSVDECWLPGEFNREVFKSSGVTIPIKTFHYPIDFEKYSDVKAIKLRRSDSELISDDTYVFYYISQWSERKNFKDLLQTYWAEFSHGEDVCLVLKTYLSDHSPEEAEHLSKTIDHILSFGKYESVPEVVLINQMVSKDRMLGIHRRCDCYISPSRGEGLGLGILEAGLLENPVITNSFGEQASYVSEETGFVYNHTLRPVTGMQPWPWYLSEQYWAQPDLKDMASKMRFCYENREEASKKGKNLRKYLENNCTYKVVGEAVIEELSESITRINNDRNSKRSETTKSGKQDSTEETGNRKGS